MDATPFGRLPLAQTLGRGSDDTAYCAVVYLVFSILGVCIHLNSNVQGRHSPRRTLLRQRLLRLPPDNPRLGLLRRPDR